MGYPGGHCYWFHDSYGIAAGKESGVTYSESTGPNHLVIDVLPENAVNLSCWCDCKGDLGLWGSLAIWVVVVLHTLVVGTVVGYMFPIPRN